MARIVGGFASSHVLFPPGSAGEQAERVLEGMLRMRAAVAALHPDVAIVIGSDHMNNFNLKAQVTLAVGVADEYTPLGDMDIPRVPFPGSRALAETLARHAATRGFDLVQVEEVAPDHGTALTRLIIDPGNTLPVVPLYINSNMPLPPSPARCFALGGVIREAVEEFRSGSERVVVVAGGGLSHWLSTTGHGQVAAAFDRYFMQMMVDGRSAELARMSSQELERASGNGGLELTSWLCMAGALACARGDILYYEPIVPWGSGMGGLMLRSE